MGTSWKPVLAGSQQQRAIDIAQEIATRLKDPNRTSKIAEKASKQLAAVKETPQNWRPSSNIYGDATLALFFGHFDRCFPNQGWDRVAHKYITNSALDIERNPRLHLGLFGGMAGLCFVTNYISRNGTRYQKLLATLDTLLYKTLFRQLPNKGTYRNGVGFHDYDTISGPSGIGTYLLIRSELSPMKASLTQILDWLIFLSKPKNNSLNTPRFFIPPDKQSTERHRDHNPYGCVDCGLAHGVPGPLTLMSLTYLHNIYHPDLIETTRDLSAWLVRQQYKDSWGINWPYSVPPDGMEPDHGIDTTRAAWCYGSPGVARTLWFVSQALNDPKLQKLSVRAIRDVKKRPRNVWGIPGPNLCHGIAGLLQTTLRFYNDTELDDIKTWSTELAGYLINLYDPKAPVGFQDLDQFGNKVDDPGFLDGASGVVLALLAASTNVEPEWDKLLLLS